MSKVVRVGNKHIVTSYVTQMEVLPPWPASTEEDQQQPRLLVTYLGRDGCIILEREAVSAGYESVSHLAHRITMAIDGLS